ncbi:MAG: hypothetical protein H0X37_05195 [Herpetosiphonaceae bacterium]|nr:hypothetical protein [Herpetosiphonaceae bacterium]
MRPAYTQHNGYQQVPTLPVGAAHGRWRWATRAMWQGLALLLIMNLVACRVRDPIPAAQLPSSAPVMHVSADQIGRAMEEDHFFSDYGYARLLVQGKVSAINQHSNHMVVQLETSVATKVLCELDTPATQVHAGETITVQSSDVQREEAAVGLKHCSIP